MAHSARFIRPGSVRIHSGAVEGLPNVACRTPDSRIVMVVMNDGADARRFRIHHRGSSATLPLGPGEIATLRWDSSMAAAPSTVRAATH